MNYLNHRLINKEAAREVFEQDYHIETVRGYYEKGFYVVNTLSLKIRGIKEAVIVELWFKEPIEGSLVLNQWKIKYASVKIGEGRKAAIELAIIDSFNKEEYLMPFWNGNRYQSCDHLIKNYSSTESSSFLLEKNVEPELLMDAFSKMPYDPQTLSETRLVLHDGKVYYRLLSESEQLKTDDEILEYVNNNRSRRDQDFIVDLDGYLYEFYSKPNDLSNIRVIRKDAYQSQPISRYSTSDNEFTYYEFAAQQKLSVDENFPIIYRVETEVEKQTYENGCREMVPFTQIIQMKIYSPRILGEKLPEFQLGDYVRYGFDQTGFIIDITEKDKGTYGVQNENEWVYYAGESARVDFVHVSLLEKIDKPAQNDIGQIVLLCNEGNTNSYGLLGYLGEVVFEFTNHYIVKVRTFKDPDRQLRKIVKGLHRSNRDYHAKYVDCNDGNIYATVLKSGCYFLRPEYVGWYKQFKGQTEQFEWVKKHNILSTFLYPLLELLEDNVIRPSSYNLDYQGYAFFSYLDYFTNNKTPEELYLSFIRHLENEKYNYLRSINLRKMYNTPEFLERFFSKTKVEELPKLEELLF